MLNAINADPCFSGQSFEDFIAEMSQMAEELHKEEVRSGLREQ